MEKKRFDIYGGATVPRSLERFRMRKALGLAALLLLMSTSAVFAQGSVFGLVQNSNLTTPANGEISFYGFTNNADNEIRLESSIGAGYDAGNWFDDFQNFLSKTPGNPYMYRFYNVANGQGAVLAKPIPNNSFQQEDILLGVVTWPAAPGGMAGRVVSATSVVLTWTRTAGQTYHVYRRPSTSQGSFFRIDNPAGLLTAPGVADSFFVDNTASGGGSFEYLLIAQDASGNLGPHSTILTVSTASIAAPAITSISPVSGSGLGGTSVVIRGSGFDVNGATATIGGAALTSVTVASPFQISGVTPAGAGVANLVVRNTASALSATLVGGYTYLGNQPPVLAVIGPRSVNEGANLNFGVSATDADGTTPVLTTTVPLPANATFTNNGNGTGTFNFSPNFTQAGTFNVTFYASDGTVTDSEQVVITVNNVNQKPLMTAIPPQTVNEGAVLTLPVSATDPDGTTPVLTTSLPRPTNSGFIDNLNGTGTFTFSPNFTQAGLYSVTFYASDGLLLDSQVVPITVVNVNRKPLMTAIPPQTVNEGAVLTLPVSATDPDGTIPVLTTSLPRPTNSGFVDNLNGTGTFTFSPNFTQAGLYSVTFYASDGLLLDSQVVPITVVNVNQKPLMTAIPPQTVNEGTVLTLPVSATDPDGTTPVLTTSLPRPTNSGFIDNLNGTGTFTFSPNFTQAGLYSVTFYASDGLLLDSQVVPITVVNVNRKPLMTAIPPQTVNEGAVLTLPVSATDPDGTIPVLTTSLPRPTNSGFVDNLNGTGTFTFSPNFTQAGLYSVTFYASDGLLLDSQVVPITVTGTNLRPLMTAIPPQTINEGTVLTLPVSATDPDGTIPVLTTSLPRPTNSGFVDNLNGTGTFTFSPNFTQAGGYSVTFYASDGLLLDSQVVPITVVNVNQKPLMTAIPPQTINEGAVLTLPVAATDPDGTTPVLTTSVPLPTNSGFVDNLNGTGTFTFSPNFTQAGLYSVTFYASDGLLLDSQVVPITVTGTNQRPLMTVIPPQTVNENALLTIPVSATDPDGATPVLTTSLPLPTNSGFVDNLNGTGTFTFSPDFTQAGLHTVTFYASDGLALDSQVVPITVVNINRPPVMTAISPRTVNAGSVLTIPVLSSDPDATFPTLTTLLPLPLNSVFVDSLNGHGLFTFSPDYFQAGSYSVTFYASDGFVTDSQVVPITVLGVGNVPPVITPIRDTIVNEGTPLVIAITAIDPDALAGQFPAISVTTTLKNYTFVDNANGTATISYSPTYFNAARDTVRIFATDFGTPRQTGVASFVITTLDVNRPPQFVPSGPFTITVGDTLRFNVVASDSTDPNPTARLDLSVTNPPANATFIDNGNKTGSFLFVPTAAQVGTSTVIFLAVDRGLPPLSATLSVVINVQTTNIPPVLAPIGPKVITEGLLLTFTVTATDADGPLPTLSAENLPLHSTFTPATGVFEFTPDFMQGGNNGTSKLAYVTFKASDGLAVAKEVVLIQIKDAGNQKPVFDSLPIDSVVEANTRTVRIRAHDPETTPLTMGVDTSTLPLNAVFADSGNGLATITFTPNYRQAGTYNITVTARDGSLADSGVVVLKVIEAGNQKPTLAAMTNKAVVETHQLLFRISATDVDGPPPHLSTTIPLPGTALFVDSLNGAGSFDWTTTNLDSGTYSVTFYATDSDFPLTYDSAIVNIHVVDTNISPIFNTVPSKQTISEKDTLRFLVSASDPDLTVPKLRAALDGTTSLAPNMSFVDSLNGTGLLTFVPDYSQGSPLFQIYNVRFTAKDSRDTNIVVNLSKLLQIQVNNKNAPPTMTFLSGNGPFTLAEGTSLSFDIFATDFDGTTPTISTGPLPSNASYSPASIFYGTFTFSPSFIQAGTYQISFMAYDALGARDSAVITVNVTESGNQRPRFQPRLADTINTPLNNLTQLRVHAVDPELGLIVLTASPAMVGTSFVDSANGSGVFSFQPDLSMVGSVFTFTFIARDPLLAADTMVTHLRVTAFLRGDLNANNKYEINDLASMIAYLFRRGPAPAIIESADANGDGFVDISDVNYMINFLYYSGPRPPQ